MKYKSFYNQKGFSLMEIIIAVSIISMSIVSIVSTFANSLQGEIRNEKRLVATYLAQEAIEIVRQQRDNNWKVAVSWNTGITTGEKIIGLIDKDDITKGWKVDIASDDRKKVYYNTNGYYAQSENTIVLSSIWEDSGFKRWLVISQDCGDDCLTVTANVSHSSMLSDVQLSARIYDWKP